jgi:hypothetical protein
MRIGDRNLNLISPILINGQICIVLCNMPQTKLEDYRNRINSLGQKNKNLFVLTPVFLKKPLDVKKTIFSLYSSSGEIYLKSNFSDKKPYIAFNETWKDDVRYSYSYRLVIPFFSFIYAFDQSGSDTRSSNFEFRYETHPDKTTQNPYPDYHLHVLDNLLPHYPTHKIEFEDFFEIITREFVTSNNLDFVY